MLSYTTCQQRQNILKRSDFSPNGRENVYDFELCQKETDYPLQQYHLWCVCLISKDSLDIFFLTENVPER